MVTLGAPWPKGWVTRWGKNDGTKPEISRDARALAHHVRKEILIDHDYAAEHGDAVESLLHEFAHVWLQHDGYEPRTNHGADFRALAQVFRVRAGFPRSRRASHQI